jgi:hypothetical protein
MMPQNIKMKVMRRNEDAIKTTAWFKQNKKAITII